MRLILGLMVLSVLLSMAADRLHDFGAVEFSPEAVANLKHYERWAANR